MSTRTENGRLDMAGPAGLGMAIFAVLFVVIVAILWGLTRSWAVLAWVMLTVTFVLLFVGLLSLLEGRSHYQDATFAFVFAASSALFSSFSFADRYAGAVMAMFAVMIMTFSIAHWRTDYPDR